MRSTPDRCKRWGRFEGNPSPSMLGRTGETAARMAALEARATDLYNIITPIPHPCDEEYTRPLQKVRTF